MIKKQPAAKTAVRIEIDNGAKFTVFDDGGKRPSTRAEVLSLPMTTFSPGHRVDCPSYYKIGQGCCCLEMDDADGQEVSR